MNQKESRFAEREMDTAQVRELTEADILMVDTKTLQKMLSCCYRTAVKIGMEAGARFQLGSVIRWKVSKINAYLENVCAQETEAKR